MKNRVNIENDAMHALFSRLALAATFSCFIGASPAVADVTSRVVATIKPLHSLVASVMLNVGEPHLIIRGNASPHTFSLRPSDAELLEGASIVFMIGDSLEPALVAPIETLARDARVVRLSEADGLVLKAFREGGDFNAHEHDEADGHDEEQEEEEDHAEEEGHADHGEFDLHIWLDPANAAVMVRKIAAVLSEEDPANSIVYDANAEKFENRLGDLTAQLTADLALVRGRPFIVFHDAYQYFEGRFGLTAVGSIFVSPERAPGAKRIAELRDKVQEAGVKCVLAEPQFNPSIVNVVIEETNSRAGTIDPLGSNIDDGPELYFNLLSDMADSFTECLSTAE